MDFAGAEKNVDAAFFAGGLYGCSCCIDVGMNAASKATDYGAANDCCDFANRLKVPTAGDGEPCLDDIDPQTGKLAGDCQLLGLGHRSAGALLSVPESGVEDVDFVRRSHVLSLRQMREKRTCEGGEQEEPCLG